MTEGYGYADFAGSPALARGVRDNPFTYCGFMATTATFEILGQGGDASVPPAFEARDRDAIHAWADEVAVALTPVAV